MKKSKKKAAVISLSVLAAIIIILAGVIMSGKTLKITVTDKAADDFYGWGHRRAGGVIWSTTKKPARI